MNNLLSLLVVTFLATTATACRKPAVENTATSGAQGGTATSGQAAQPATPPKPMPAQLPEVLARVNGEAVTKADFDRLIKNMELRANQPVPAERRDEVYRKALEQLVTYTVLSQETRARQVSATDAEVESGVKQMRGQFPSDEAFKEALEARGMTLDKLKADTRIDISINKMVEAEVSTAAPPTDVQVREFYDKNPDKFKQEESIRASHILFRVDENADAATKKKTMDQAQSVLKQARAGADFGELAKKHSADGSAQQGGDLNFFTHGQMVPAFDQAAFALKTGEISDIVETPSGFHVLKVLERRPGGDATLEESRPQIETLLQQQKEKEALSQLLAKLKTEARIEIIAPVP